MKIWIGKKEGVYCTTGYLSYPGINRGCLNWDETDAVPFIFSLNLKQLVLGTNKDIHDDIWVSWDNLRPGLNLGYNYIAGRLWTDSRVMTFYNNYLNKFPGSSLLQKIIDDIKANLNIDFSNYKLIKSLGRIDDRFNVILEMPVDEYLSMSLSGNEDMNYFMSRCSAKNIIDMRDEDWESKLRQTKTPGKVENFPGDDTYSKLQNMRQWNGYPDVAESKAKKKVIVNESQLRLILNEIASAEIDERAQDVNLNPTDGQKQAGNYKMAHISVKGMEIAIENPKGSKRYFTDEKTGEKKYTVMNNHYGYFNITKGKDGDAVDVFIGPDIDNFENVYCVDQNNKEGEFDETKVMLGFTSKEQAKEAYLSNYSPGWKGFRAITGVSLKHFKKWLYRGRKQRQPFEDYVYVQKKKITESTNGNLEQQKRFRTVVDIIKERIKGLEECGGDDKFDGRKYVKTDYYFSTLVNEYLMYGRQSFVEKAVARALREVSEEGIKLNYYKGI